jgi:HTH-type transcriptional regulator, cell division transcriptional repressor
MYREAMEQFDSRKLAENLRKLTDDKRVQQADIARRLKVSKQLVSHWFHGRSELTVPHLVALADILGVSTDQLLLGRERGSTRDDITPSGNRVPIFTSAELLELAEGLLTRDRASNSYFANSYCSPQSVAFRIFDRAMYPVFGDGDVVVVDPLVLPQPGDCIAIALPQEQTLLFRRYRPPPKARAADPPYALDADGAYFEPRTVRKKDRPVFLGTLREHIRVGARANLPLD